MPMKLYDTKEAVPEAVRATAIETKDGKFAVDEVDPALGEAGKRALEEERAARKKEADARKAAEKERDDLKRAAEAREKGISDDELQKIRDKEAADRKPIEEERDRLKQENRKLKLDDRARALALKAGVMPDRLDKAMKDLAGRLDLTEGGDTIIVKDAKGGVTTETIEDFLSKTYKAEAPFFYAGPGGSGSGGDGSSGGGGGGYDAVAAGKAAAEEQKKGREQNSLAFK